MLTASWEVSRAMRAQVWTALSPARLRPRGGVDVTRLLTPLPVARGLIPVTLLHILMSLLPDLTCAHFITLQTHSRLAQGLERTENVSDHRLHRNNPREHSKEPKVRTKVPKADTRAKHRKLVSQVLKTRNRRQARTFRNLHRHVPLTLPGTMAEVSMNGMMTGVLLDGEKVGNKRMAVPQAHFHLEVGCRCHQSEAV